MAVAPSQDGRGVVFAGDLQEVRPPAFQLGCHSSPAAAARLRPPPVALARLGSATCPHSGKLPYRHAALAAAVAAAPSRCWTNPQHPAARPLPRPRPLPQDGGTCAARTRALGLDLSGYDGLCLRVKSDGQTFQIDLSQEGKAEAYEALIETPDTGDWATVRLPFHDFVAVKGGDVDPEAEVLTVRGRGKDPPRGGRASPACGPIGGSALAAVLQQLRPSEAVHAVHSRRVLSAIAQPRNETADQTPP
jgi:hypothetical protein